MDIQSRAAKPSQSVDRETMPRMERGILGVKKDPKRQILFKYSVRDGEEWPSDSSDEDFTIGPSREELPRHKRRRHKNKKSKDNDDLSKTPSKRKRQSAKGTEDKCISKTGSDLWGTCIPSEVLHKVFSYVVEMEGSIPFLLRAKRVNHHWGAVASDRSLWTSADLSYGWVKKVPSNLLTLCDRQLEKAKKLDLSGWANLNDQSLGQVANSCRLLEVINLSGCKSLNAAGIQHLVDTCQSLHSINMSSICMHRPLKSDLMRGKPLCNILDKCGHHLQELILRENRVIGFGAALTNITKTCHQLGVLDLSDMVFSSDYLSLNIEALQEGCPLLRVLRLNGCPAIPLTYCVMPGTQRPNGFPELEELCFAGIDKAATLSLRQEPSGNTLRRLLWNSCRLRVLDLRNTYTHVARDLCSYVPLGALKCLYASRAVLAKEEEFWVILQKCRDSLEELHMEWACHDQAKNEKAMKTLTEGCSRASALKVLDLAGNDMTSSAVRVVLNGCPKLDTLDLSSCRGLPRGVKRLYEGRRQLTKLTQTLSQERDSD